MQALACKNPSTAWGASKGFVRVEAPTPALHEPEDAESVILRVRFAGVCGSDRGIWFRESFKDMIVSSTAAQGQDRRIVGHECFGEIVDAGLRVKEKYGFQVGDTVSAESHVTCGACLQCRAGELHVCTEEKIMGITIDGCFAEYVKLPAKVLWLTDPAKIRPEIAAMQEPFGNAVHACSKVDVRGKRVAIFGCGPIGLFSVLVARALGASEIIAIEPNAAHASLAREFGAEVVLDIPKAEKAHIWDADAAVVEAIKDATHGAGVDVALEMAGYNSSVANAVASVRRGGNVVLFGLKSGDFTIPAFDRMIVRGVGLHSVIGRQIWKTWYTTKTLLEDATHGIQDKLWRLMLKGGEGTIVPLASYESVAFEDKLLNNPKILLQCNEPL